MNNKERILEISKKLKLSHIGSNISCLPILEEIYEKKKPGDKVLLSGGHAHLAHLLVMYSYIRKEPPENLDEVVETIIEKYGIHCDRQAGCDFSSGSLGHAIGAGIGMALADRNRTIFIVTTDGALQEGSEWEALHIKTRVGIDNLKIIVNMNGFTAVAEIDKEDLSKRLRAFCPDIDIRYTNNGEGFEGVRGHYKIIDD